MGAAKAKIAAAATPTMRGCRTRTEDKMIVDPDCSCFACKLARHVGRSLHAPYNPDEILLADLDGMPTYARAADLIAWKEEGRSVSLLCGLDKFSAAARAQTGLG